MKSKILNCRFGRFYALTAIFAVLAGALIWNGNNQVRLRESLPGCTPGSVTARIGKEPYREFTSAEFYEQYQALLSELEGVVGPKDLPRSRGNVFLYQVGTELYWAVYFDENDKAYAVYATGGWW